MGGFFDIDHKIIELSSLNEQLQNEEIWSDRDKTLALSKKKSGIEKDLNDYKSIYEDFSQLKELKFKDFLNKMDEINYIDSEQALNILESN